jgi:hypothetical protein
LKVANFFRTYKKRKIIREDPPKAADMYSGKGYTNPGSLTDEIMSFQEGLDEKINAGSTGERPGWFDPTDFVNLILPFALTCVVLLYAIGMEKTIDLLLGIGIPCIGAVLVIVFLVFFFVDLRKALSMRKANNLLKGYAGKHGLEYKPGNVRFFASRSVPADARGSIMGHDLLISIGFSPDIDIKDGGKYDLGKDHTVICVSLKTEGTIIVANKRSYLYYNSLPLLFDSFIEPVSKMKKVAFDRLAKSHKVTASSPEHAQKVLTINVIEETAKGEYSLFIGQNKALLGWDSHPKTVKDLQDKVETALRIIKEVASIKG